MAKLPAEEPVPLYMRPQMVRSYIKVEISIKCQMQRKKNFQDPYSSLDSRLKVHDIIVEGMRIHKLVRSKEEEYSGSVVKAKM